MATRKKKDTEKLVKVSDVAPVTLEKLRADIDRVDENIQALLNERASLARKAGISKHVNGHTVDFYPPRARVPGAAHGPRAQQGPVAQRGNTCACSARSCRPASRRKSLSRWATSVPEGTFSQTATFKHFGHSVRALALASVDEVFPRGGSGPGRFRRGAGGELHRGVRSITPWTNYWARRCGSVARSSCASISS